MFDVGLDVLGALRQARQGVRSKVDTGEQVLPEAALCNVYAQVSIRPSDQLEIAADLPVAAHRQRLGIVGCCGISHREATDFV